MRRALAPLGRLTRAAAEIERTGDPRRRLPQPETDDEVGRLATTLNRMLAALERSREGERRFLADASHELRTPLTALVGNVAYLAKHGASGELIAELEDDTRRLAQLADDLLALSREEAARAAGGGVRLDELARSFAGEGVDVRSEPVSVRGDPEALERALTNLVENARRHGRGRITVETRTLDGRALLTVSDEGRGLSAEEAEHAFERFWRGEAPGPGSGLGLAIVQGDRRAARRPRLRRGRPLHDRSPGCQRSLRVRRYNRRRTAREGIAMSYLRRLSTRSLLLVIAGVCLLAIGGAAIAIAAGGGGPTPAAKPLDQAIQDALSGQHPDGVTARVQFTNNLFPSGALVGQAGSALMTGASGRLWLTGDGQGRIELQSDSGDVQIVWTSDTISVYDASSNTVYRATLPASSSQDSTTGSTRRRRSPTSTPSWPTSACTGRSPTRSPPTSPASPPTASRHRRSTTAACSARSSSPGTPRTARRSGSGIYAQGSSTPALELAVSDISYGPVASSDVDVAPPSSAKVVDLGSGSTSSGTDSGTPAVTGLDAVQAAAGFPVVAPDSLVGLPRQDVRLVGGDTVLVLYGQGLGGIALVERASDSSGAAGSQLSGPADRLARRRDRARARDPARAPCSNGRAAARASCWPARFRRPRPRRRRGQ